MTTTKETTVLALYSQESNWELWPQREYRLLTDEQVDDLPDEYSSMWAVNFMTAEEIISELQNYANSGNWTAQDIIEQLSK